MPTAGSFHPARRIAERRFRLGAVLQQSGMQPQQSRLRRQFRGLERSSRSSGSYEGRSWPESLHRRSVVREGRDGLRGFAAVCEYCSEGEGKWDLELWWCDALGRGRGTLQCRSERKELYAGGESCADGYLYLEKHVLRAPFGWVSLDLGVRSCLYAYIYSTISPDRSLPGTNKFQNGYCKAACSTLH